MRLLGGVLLAVLVIVGLLTLLGQGPQVPGFGLGADAEESGPELGYAARDARLVQTDDLGMPQYVLEAEGMRQAPDTRDIEAEGLDLRYAPPEGSDAPPWRLTAKTGLLPPESTKVQLRGEVRLTGRLPGARGDVRFETSALDFDLESQIAESRQPVILRSAGGRLSARGFIANLKEGTLRLESSVHGRFSP